MEQPTRADAIDYLVRKSKRRQATPIRHTFLQQQVGGNPAPGPLHSIVRRQNKRTLDLYLLVLLVAVAPPYKAINEAGGWARAIGLNPHSRRAEISRAWKRLEDLKLITRRREGGKAAITLLREDGSGEQYTPPTGRPNAERYLRLPLEYWRNDWYRRLSLPATAMLLIALSLRDDFYLPVESVPEWYGLSSDTAGRGLQELKEAGLLHYEDRRKSAPMTAFGSTLDRRYTLQPPFGPKSVSAQMKTDQEGRS